MNGPEHYREAEARVSASDYQRQQGDLDTAGNEAQLAQVHATLALAAATALRTVGEWVEIEDDALSWARALEPTTPRPPTKGRVR